MKEVQKLFMTFMLIYTLIIAIPSASMAQTEQITQNQSESTISEDSNRSLKGCLKAFHVQVAGGVISSLNLGLGGLGMGLQIMGNYGSVRDCW